MKGQWTQYAKDGEGHLRRLISKRKREMVRIPTDGPPNASGRNASRRIPETPGHDAGGPRREKSVYPTTY